ncbi:hypothetical protein JOF35_008484 [Streptomyces demainii]|uniref:Uncharacterized protein n=1 Tax=Streptomyces demainii TaxID=588122 RepID=A0ABT9L9E1_9ACTN|nr:hypothetical protein [Streptomyces demainii]
MSRDAAVGNVDSRVVKATIAAIEDRTDTSTDTRARMLRHVERFGHDEYGEYGEAVTMPSLRRSTAWSTRPEGPFRTEDRPSTVVKPRHRAPSDPMGLGAGAPGTGRGALRWRSATRLAPRDLHEFIGCSGRLSSDR